MTRTLVIVRTYRADVASLDAFDLLAGAGLDADIIFCVDERKAAADMGGRPKVRFDTETLTKLGLYAHPNCGWRCGDYFYYVTRDARPEYDYYWLIEPDVRIHVSKLTDFFGPLARVEADLLAAQYGPRSDLWGWTRTIIESDMPVYGCLYPITRLSGSAIDALLRVRRAWSADSRMATALDWPNDEAFTASALTAAGYACQDLKAILSCYTPQSLSVAAVVDYDLVLRSPPDGLIYHPVREFGPWLERAEQRIGSSSPEADLNGRSRSHASYLGGVAQTCLGHPALFSAALVPLMLARDLWTERRWAEEKPSETVAADAHQAELCALRLRRKFGISGQQAPCATAYLARAKPHTGKAPSADDFELWGEMPLRSYPVSSAVPYAFNMATSEVFSTLHVSSRAILAASEPAVIQRRTARAVVRVDFDAVSSAGQQHAPSAAVFSMIFGAERIDLGVISAACDARGVIILNLPGPLGQLLSDAATRRDFLALPDRQNAELLRWCLLSFLRLHVDGDTQRHVVVCLPSSASSVASALINAIRPIQALIVVDESLAFPEFDVHSAEQRPGFGASRGLVQDLISEGHNVRYVSATETVALLREIMLMPGMPSRQLSAAPPDHLSVAGTHD